MRKVAGVIAAVLGAALLYLLLWPVPIEPARWTPAEQPALAGPYEPNTLLASLERLELGGGQGPEDVAVDRQGQIYAGVHGGRLLRLRQHGTAPEIFAETGGRPLGLQHDRTGNLIVADAERGLLSVSPNGSVTVLATEHGGVPFGLTDDVDVAADGTIFFSDASFKFTIRESTLDLMEHRPNGRLLAYDPTSGMTRLILDSLYFANGVAVSPDQSFVLVVETGKYRVRRVWLNGPRAGQTDVFIGNLPGFPDGISSNGFGLFWLALVSPRLKNVDRRLLPHPVLRKMVMRLPGFMRPAAGRYGFVLGLDSDGRVVHNLQDPAGLFAQVTSVQEHSGTLYLGSLVEGAIGRLVTPAGWNE